MIGLSDHNLLYIKSRSTSVRDINLKKNAKPVPNLFEFNPRTPFIYSVFNFPSPLRPFWEHKS